MVKQLYEGDSLDLLDNIDHVPLIIADPPDNLRIKYDGFTDYRADYYEWIEQLIIKALHVTNCFWLSYYWEHDLQIKAAAARTLRDIHRSAKAKSIIWRYTFGQYKDSDFGSGFRFLLRFWKPAAKFRPDSVRIPSKRMALNDPRSKGPKVPDDVWEIPRVVGNSSERRAWHPTQHPEFVYHRIICMHSDPGDTVVDLFAGTGTIFRVAEPLQRNSIAAEVSPRYCGHLRREHHDIRNYVF